jgi:hypothetical protein
VPYLSLCGYSSCLIDFGLLILNLVCGYALDYPCIFFLCCCFWLWGTLLICGIYGRGVGDEILLTLIVALFISWRSVD